MSPIRFWQNLSLAKQFAAAAFCVLLPAAIAVGWWLPGKVNDAVIRNTAGATVLYMDGLLAPLISEIKTSDSLSAESSRKLDTLVEQSRKSGKIVSIKIWRLDGTILYSTFSDNIGKKFEMGDDFQRARNGFLAADFDNVAHEEDAREREAGVPLLEVYAPVRDPQSRDVIAVSEFYADGTQLGSDISNATYLSWFVVGAATSLLLGLLSLIVARGSNTIETQRRDLIQKVDELQTLLNQNEALRADLRQSNENVAGLNERVLQRVGAELHDGPAQKIFYSILRTSRIRRSLERAKLDQGDLDEIKNILQEAVREVRNLSAGLMLPELEQRDLGETIRLAVKLHQEYTGTEVSLKMDLSKPYNNQALKTCIYRFVQEALGNSFKHADGRGLAVEIDDQDGIAVRVSDRGPGIDKGVSSPTGLGIFGMRSRVAALGGTLDIASNPGQGMALTMKFPQKIQWS